jgi:hypothetical protein
MREAPREWEEAECTEVPKQGPGKVSWARLAKKKRMTKGRIKEKELGERE